MAAMTIESSLSALEGRINAIEGAVNEGASRLEMAQAMWQIRALADFVHRDAVVAPKEQVHEQYNEPPLPGWPFATSGYNVWIRPTYLYVDGHGVYRLPSSGTYASVTCNTTGWIILRVMKTTPGARAYVNEASSPSATTTTHWNFPVCTVEMVGDTVRIVDRLHVGPFFAYGVLT